MDKNGGSVNVVKEKSEKKKSSKSDSKSSRKEKTDKKSHSEKEKHISIREPEVASIPFSSSESESDNESDYSKKSSTSSGTSSGTSDDGSESCISMTSDEIIDNDPLYFILSKLFITSDGKRNVADILDDICKKLKS
jgi:hypothetical protein